MRAVAAPVLPFTKINIASLYIYNAGFICYDDACHLKKYTCNPARRTCTPTAERLSSLNLVVDKLGHVDPRCHQNCNPYKFEELNQVCAKYVYNQGGNIIGLQPPSTEICEKLSHGSQVLRTSCLIGTYTEAPSDIALYTVYIPYIRHDVSNLCHRPCALLPRLTSLSYVPSNYHQSLRQTDQLKLSRASS